MERDQCDPGHVRSRVTLRHSPRRIPRTVPHHIRRGRVLLHGENPHLLPVRRERRRPVGTSERLVCGYCQRVLHATLPHAGGPRGQRSPDHRAGDDLHFVRGCERKPDVQQLSQPARVAEVLGHHRHRRSSALRLPQEPQGRVQVQLALHPRALHHQHPGDRLLPVQGTGLGVGQGEVLHRRQEVPHLHRHHRVQLHLADLPALAGGQHAEAQRVPLHDELDSHRRLHPQRPVRPGGLPDVGRRDQGGDHRQPAVQHPSRRQHLLGGQGAAVVPAAVLRRRRGPGKDFLPRRRARLLPGLLRGRRPAQVVGSVAPLRPGRVHHAHGHLRAPLRAPHGPDGQPDGRRPVLSPPQPISSQVVVEKALVAPGLLRRGDICDRGYMQYFRLHPLRRGPHRGVQIQPARLVWKMTGGSLVISVTHPTY